MTGVPTVRDIYAGATIPSRGARGQGDVGHNGAAPVEDALRSVRREFDTRPVSMDLRHPAAIDGPEKSGASARS